ncbi:MAG: PEP-CTERM sorting domain-containing protein [Rhodocyclaceae bacterium]|nr:PEP-CTERM sorting domain-containing protein [Rhodocyclaceae bacterium]
MRLTHRLIPGLLAALVAAPSAFATTISASGYTATDAIPFHWDELTNGYNNPVAGATRVLGNNDDSLASMSMEYLAPTDRSPQNHIGMDFFMFGSAISRWYNPGVMFISSNGLLSFGCPAHYNASGQTITCYPTSTSGNTALNVNWLNAPSIAAAWDDWTTTPNSTDGVYWAFLGAVGSKRLVVEWHDTMRYGSGNPTTVSFETVLYEATNQVELRYLKMATGNSATAQGVSATAGIRDAPTIPSGATDNYLQWSMNQAVLTGGTSILFTPDAVAQSGGASVPEPGSYGLLAVGLGLMGRSLRRRKA